MTMGLDSPIVTAMETHYSYLDIKGKSDSRRPDIWGNTKIIHTIKKIFFGVIYNTRSEKKFKYIRTI